MEKLLISNARLIRFANNHGIKKILRNVIAVRQNVKTLSSWCPNSDFDRAREFYGLFTLGPQVCPKFLRFENKFLLKITQNLLDSIKKKKKFTFEEYQAMLNLQCGVDQTMGQAGVNQASDRNYNTYIIDLHGLELEHSNVEPGS